jgi:hypothetical protein
MDSDPAAPALAAGCSSAGLLQLMHQRRGRVEAAGLNQADLRQDDADGQMALAHAAEAERQDQKRASTSARKLALAPVFCILMLGIKARIIFQLHCSPITATRRRGQRQLKGSL